MSEGFRRRALIIGNDAYAINKLHNCVNGAVDVASALEAVKYEITMKKNLTLKNMSSCINKFIISIQPNDFIIFFYSGHVMQKRKGNFLVPCDEPQVRPNNYLQQQEIDIQKILYRMIDRNPSAVILLLDCCRKHWASKNQRMNEQPLGGLSEMEAPNGTLIMFACAPDKTVRDESTDMKHSVFTKCLLKHITTPGINIKLIIQRVRAAVAKETNNEQQPFRVDSIDKENVYIVPPGSIERQNNNIQNELHQRKSNSEKIKLTIDYFKSNKDNIDSNMLEILNNIQYTMIQMYELCELTTPRYFFILPTKLCDPALTNSTHNLFQMHYKLYFLCECSHDPLEVHIAPHDGYSVKNLKEFITKYAQYLRITLNLIQTLAQVRGFINHQLGETIPFFDDATLLSVTGVDGYDSFMRSIELVDILINGQDFETNSIDCSLTQSQMSTKGPVRSRQLRELETYLERSDDKTSLGNLHRTVTQDSYNRWVCLRHYDEIGFQKPIRKYVIARKAMGDKFDWDKKRLFIEKKSVTSDYVRKLCEALDAGLNIRKLVFQDCSFNEYDFDKLLFVILNRSSISCLQMLMVNISQQILKSNYKCQYMTITFSNQTMRISFNNIHNDANVIILERLLSQNKIYRQLDFSASDFLWHEDNLKQCLDANDILKSLVVKNCNNIDILNSILNLRKAKLNQIKLCHSLNESSTILSFCDLLKNNRTLSEIDLMEELGFQDETFVVNLLNTLEECSSIKYLKLHVSHIQSLTYIEIQLIQSLKDNKFISHLCLSESVVSSTLTEAFIHASKECKILVYLKFYNCQMAADDKAKLQSLYDAGDLKQLGFYDKPRWYLLLEETKGPPKRVVPNLPINPRWEQNGITIAGGYNLDENYNQLNRPLGIIIDDDEDSNLFIADQWNHRIVRCKTDSSDARVVAGGRGSGNRIYQLFFPSDVLVDKEANSLIIADGWNSRVIRRLHRNGMVENERLIDSISCCGLAMDEKRNLYVSDWNKHEVRRYEINRGDKTGTVVAGGNRKGKNLHQLNEPYHIFIDGNQSLYVSDSLNHRIMRWDKGATEGVVVAGGQEAGNALTQLSYPNGIFVDPFGTLYVADFGNHRVIRWPQGAKQGTVLVGRNGPGTGEDQLKGPSALLFDKHGNLYVSDTMNNRVQRFNLIK